MRTLFAFAVACVLVGCGCKTPPVPAQPGWKIIVNTPEEAAALREGTGNDLTRTGRVVEITVPTFIQGTR